MMRLKNVTTFLCEVTMRTPASIAKHPVHPMLIVLPIGLWVFSLACDLAYVLGSGDDTWLTVALYTLAGGLIGALLAAIPGLIDLLSLPSGEVRRLALIHMALNLSVVGLYAINLWLRVRGSETMTLPISLSVVSVAILAVSGWLGAEMVHVHGVGVSAAPAQEGQPASMRPEAGSARESNDPSFGPARKRSPFS
jgi:uncharacterized membrane protein